MQKNKLVSSIPALIMVPLRRLFSRDNFAGGIVFGAIFGLVVNVATVQLQESIQGQRALEAVEYEIVSHLLQARSVITTNEEKLKYENLELFSWTTPYSERVGSSSEGIKYISKLNPALQGKLVTYYRVIIQGHNSLVEASNEYIAKETLGCEHKPPVEYQMCKGWQEEKFLNEISSAEAIIKNSTELLKEFHPTQDRLDSWLMRLFIGKDSPGIFKTR